MFGENILIYFYNMEIEDSWYYYERICKKMGGSYNCNYFYYKYFFGYKSERDDISNACTGNRILTSLKIREVIITRKKLSELA